MDLILSHNSAANATFCRADDERPLYEVKTGGFHKVLFNRESTITKLPGDSEDGQAEVIGYVKLHVLSPITEGSATFRGKDITPRRKALLKQETLSFTASDGKVYKWKNPGLKSTLVPEDNEDIPIAFFDYGSIGLMSQKRPAMLSITPEGMHIVEEIVITYVYARRLRETQRATALDGGGAGP